MSNLIKMTDPHTGAEVRFDPSSGHVFDAQGNTITKWEFRESNFNKLVAATLADKVNRNMVSALRLGDHEKAEFTARQLADRSGQLVRMDTGPADVHIPSALPNYASGYHPDLPMADVVAPVLPVGKPTDKYWKFDIDDAFEGVVPDGGTGSGALPEISPRLANTQFTVQERALSGHVSTQTAAAADAALKIALATSNRIFNALTINRELRVMALLTNSSNWDSACVNTLDSSTKWKGGASSDPVKDLLTAIEASAMEPNGILMSRDSYNAFVQNDKVKGYYFAKDNANAIPSPGQLSSLLQLPPIYIASMKWKNNSGLRKYIWTGKTVLFRIPEQMPPATQDDLSTAVTFRWTTPDVKDGATVGGFIVRQYFDPRRGSMGGNTMVVIHHDAEVQTSAYVGGLIENTLG